MKELFRRSTAWAVAALLVTITVAHVPAAAAAKGPGSGTQASATGKAAELASGETDRPWLFHEGAIRVRLAKGASLADVLQRNGLSKADPIFRPPFSPLAVEAGFDRAFKIPVPRGREKELVKQLARRTTDFEFVGLDYIDDVKQTFSPNDTLFQAGYQGNLDVINMRQAWDRTVSWADIKIAILDGGLRGTHEDLVGKSQMGFQYTDRTYTLPNTNNDDQVGPPGLEGHGTRVAGLAAAGTNNGKGIAATGFNSSLIPVKVFDSNGVWIGGPRGDPIIQAASMGALVINMSYRRTTQDENENTALRVAFENYHIALVAAAGNDGNTNLTFPCANGYVVCVANSNNDGSRHASSTYGSFVDVAAPGVSVWSTDRDSDTDYQFATGTSFAAAQVSGVMALLRACGHEPGAARSALFGAARANDYTIHGLVDAGAALFSVTC